MKETFEDISSEKTFSAAYRFPNPTEERRYCDYYLKEHSQMMYIIYAVVFIVNLSLIFRIAFDDIWHYALIPIIINQILVLIMFHIIKKKHALYNMLSGIINIAFSVEVFCYENRFSSNSLNNYYQLCGFLIFGAHTNLMLSSQLLYDGLGFLLSFFIYSYQLAEVNRITEIFLMWSVILLSFYQKFQHHKFTRILYISMQQQQEWIEVIQNVLPSAVISISNSINSNDSANNLNQKINIKKSSSSLASSHLLSNWTLNLANQQSKLAYQIKDMKSFSSFANCVLVDTRELVHEGIAPMPEINPLNGNESSNFSKSHRYSNGKFDKQVENLDGLNQFSLGSTFQEKQAQISNNNIVNKKNINISNSTFQQQSHHNLNIAVASSAEKPQIVISNNLNNNNNNNNSLSISTGFNGNTRKLSLKQNPQPAQITEVAQQNMKKNVLLTTLSPSSLQIPDLKVNNNSSEHLQYYLNPSNGQGQGASSAAIIQQISTVELGQQLATTMAVGNGGGIPFLNDKSSQLGTENILGANNTIRFHSTMSMNADVNNQQITLFKQLQWMYDDWELTKEQPSEKNKFFIWKFNGKYYPKLLQEEKQEDIGKNEQINEINKGELSGINKRLEKLKGELNSNNNIVAKKDTQQDKKQDSEQDIIAVQIKVCGFRGRKTRLVLCVDDISVSEKIQLCRSQDKYKDLILANVAHDLRQPLNTLNYTISEAKDQLLKLQNIPENSKETLQNIMELLEMADVSGSSLKYLINDILDHAKLKEGKLQVNFGQCSLLKVIQFTQKMFEFAFKERSIKFRILNKTNIDQIFTDQQRLQQIILNLLSNAIKFTPANKYIILQITKVHKIIRDKQVSLLKIMVMDQGCGMSQEQLNQIFAPYVSFNHQNLNIEGIGLGLHICKSIIGLLGPFPKLYVKSKLQQGTKFYFYIYHQFKKSQVNQIKQSPSPASIPPVVSINNNFGDEDLKTPKLPWVKDPSSEDNQNKGKTDDFNKINNLENQQKQNVDDTDKKDGQSLELSGLNDVVEKKRAMSIVEREEKQSSSLSFQGDNDSEEDDEEEEQNSELNMTSLVMQLPDIDENEDNYQCDQDHEDMSRSNLIEKYKQNGELNTPITVLNTNRPITDITHRTIYDQTYDNPLNQLPFNLHDRKDINQHLLRQNSSKLDISDISTNQLTHTIIHKTNDYIEDDQQNQNSSFSIKPIINNNNSSNNNNLTLNTNNIIPFDKILLSNQSNQTTPTHRYDIKTEGHQLQRSTNQQNQYFDNSSSTGKHINSQSVFYKIISTTSKPLIQTQYQRQSSFPKKILVSSKPTQPQMHQIPITSISSNTNNSFYSFGNPKISSINATTVKNSSQNIEEINQQQPSLLRIADMTNTQLIQKNQISSNSSAQQVHNSSSNGKSNNSKTNSQSNTNSNGSKIRDIPFLSRRVSSLSGSLIQVQKEELQVLIADDDSYSIQILKMMLKKSGQFSFVTKDVFNGNDSFQEFMHRNKPESKKPFVLVITDINMPIMNGIESTNKMRKAITEQGYHNAVFMGISGIDQDKIAADPQMSAQYKVFDVVLSKPLKEQSIINAINQNFLGFY